MKPRLAIATGSWLGVSAATINARLTQARMALREKLDPPPQPLKT